MEKTVLCTVPKKRVTACPRRPYSEAVSLADGRGSKGKCGPETVVCFLRKEGAW